MYRNVKKIPPETGLDDAKGGQISNGSKSCCSLYHAVCSRGGYPGRGRRAPVQNAASCEEIQTENPHTCTHPNPINPALFPSTMTAGAPAARGIRTLD